MREWKSLSLFYSAISFMATFGFLAAIYISLGNDAVVLIAFSLFLLYLVPFSSRYLRYLAAAHTDISEF